jgi:hypothetical protein
MKGRRRWIKRKLTFQKIQLFNFAERSASSIKARGGPMQGLIA